MKVKTFVILILGALFAIRIAGRIVLAQAIAAPNAAKFAVVKLALNARYEIATPHESLLQEVRFAIFPTAHAQIACFVGNCDTPVGFKPKAVCNDSCAGGCGNCPDCFTGPCTIYKCAAAITSSKCKFATNSDLICSACENDQGCS